MKVSIIFATYKRNGILQSTLQGYQKLDEVLESEIELIIIDNGCLRSTEDLVLSFTFKHIKLIFDTCEKAGKNSSLNKGLIRASGEYIILTDDDAIPDKNLISNYIDAFNFYPEISVFGGPIFPTGLSIPQWVDVNDSSMQGAYVIREQKEKDTFVSPTYIWGPNMAVKKAVFDSGYKFNENIGPNGTDYVMGSETEFLSRLEELGFKALYLKDPIVFHQIRPEQLHFSWLKQRAVRQGRGTAHYKHKKGFDYTTWELYLNCLAECKVLAVEFIKSCLRNDKGRLLKARYKFRLKITEFNYQLQLKKNNG